ncbi:hypothetical protein KRX51_06555 [Corynebacterium sp. TAE3-ERU12]|uniref:acyl-CoA carboxylase epsilon subunit n=1 Tax=Corynebacterium sp. TAE3-ERU12 TaxID=2849491 RepID=UPI001C49053B|nr:acyl-CoA carboxylase epsilon subunit [Corynebacterium sp. TAE3-ERU12]MBV7295577.1 hypothetical protein [Corynebacterium sp. TAE3-ERU12]
MTDFEIRKGNPTEAEHAALADVLSRLTARRSPTRDGWASRDRDRSATSPGSFLRSGKR